MTRKDEEADRGCKRKKNLKAQSMSEGREMLSKRRKIMKTSPEVVSRFQILICEKLCRRRIMGVRYHVIRSSAD